MNEEHTHITQSEMADHEATCCRHAPLFVLEAVEKSLLVFDVTTSLDIAIPGFA